MEKILVFVEIKAGEPRKASLELLCATRKLASPGRFDVEAVVLGPLPAGAKEKVLLYTGKLTNITDPVLTTYTAEGTLWPSPHMQRKTGLRIVMAGATRIGRDFMPRVAVLLEAGIASDVPP